MRKLALSLAALVSLSTAGAASAQTFVGSGTGPVSVDASLVVEHTIPGGIPCVWTASGSVGSGSVSTAFAPLPFTLCWALGIIPIQAANDFVIDPIPGDYSRVVISNITANSVVGACGPGSVIAYVLPIGGPHVPPIGPPVELYIPSQYIPGSPQPDCKIEGFVTLNNVVLI